MQSLRSCSRVHHRFEPFGIMPVRLGMLLALLAGPWGMASAGADEQRRVELTLHGRDGASGLLWPVTFGVPFPEGTLDDDDLATLRLSDASGEPVALQTRVTARWLDDSVQWVLIDAQARLSDEPTTYRLSWGAGASAEPSAASAVTFEEQDDEIVVNTGELAFAVSKRHLAPLASVRVKDGAGGWVSAFPAGEQAELYLADGQGNAYRGTLSDEPEVVVEEAGPQRVSIKLEGWMVSEAGERLGRRIVRVQAFAGMRTLRVLDTFVNTADTQEVTFGNIALHLPYEGDRYQYLGVDESEASVRESAYLLQYEADAYELVSDGERRKRQGRAPGRVRVSAGATAYTVAWRHFWQMYPNELEVTPGTLKLHFWPRHGKEASYRQGSVPVTLENIVPLQWVHEGEVLDFSTPGPVVNFDHPDYRRDYRFNVLTNLAEHDNALGIARTSEYWLDFHGEQGDEAEVAARADAFEAHPLMLADPQWLADSQAFWNIAARSDHYEQVEDGPERMLDFLFDTMYERVGSYGKWTYGAYNNNYLPGFEHAWIHRPWQVFYQGGSRWPWLALARSGDPRFFDHAEKFARHLMDVSVVHWEDQAFNARHWDTAKPFWRVGAKRRGGAASVVGLVPWYDGASTAFDTDVDYALWYYYLTGYQRAHDVAMMQGELLLRQEALLRREQGYADAKEFPDPALFPTPEIADAYNNRFRGSVHDLLTPGRQGTAPGAAALHLYRATHDDRYLRMAQRIMNHYRKIEDENPGAAYAQHYYAPFIVRYWEVTRDESLKPYIVRWARDRMKEKDARTWDGRDQYYDQMALAYQLTGDVAFLEHGLAQTQVMQDNRFANLEAAVEGVPYWTGLPSGIGYIGQTWGHFARALEDHYEKTGERLLPPEQTQAYPFVSIVSSTKPGAAHQIVLHLHKERGEAVNLGLRFNSRGDDVVEWVLENSQGRRLKHDRVPARPVQGRATPTSAEGTIRVALAANVPTGDYRITLRSESRIDLHWPYPEQNQYRKLVVEAPVVMSPRMGPPLRVFMPRRATLELDLPTIYKQSYATYRLYDAQGQEVFAQTGAGTTNTPASFTVSVPDDQHGRPWFYRRSPSQASQSESDLRIEGILPIWGFTAETFFVPEQFQSPGGR